MDATRARVAAQAMDRYVAKRDGWSVIALLIDVSMYVIGVMLSVAGHHFWIKCVGVAIASVATSTLFVLGHDAAHRSLFASRRANAIVGRLVFLPCLHNHTLWLFQHNYLHHQQTNVRGFNSYSPMSPKEFREASIWRRAIERTYRSPAGFGIYYLIERWGKHKLLPGRETPTSMRHAASFDAALLLAWVACLCVILFLAGVHEGYSHPAIAIVWGFVLPFLLWNQLIGLTVFVQHTHPRVYWLGQRNAKRGRASQTEATVDVRCPRWYDVLTHNVMVHPAHHVNPRIPWYRLKAAQRELDKILGEEIVIAHMSVRFILSLCRECQLYDYGTRQWLNFGGEPTHENDAIRLVESTTYWSCK